MIILWEVTEIPGRQKTDPPLKIIIFTFVKELS